MKKEVRRNTRRKKEEERENAEEVLHLRCGRSAEGDP